MFFENEPTRTLTLIEFLLVMLIGLVPVAINIWMKPVLSRRRVAEEERDSLARADHRSREAAGRAGVFSGRYCRAILPSSRTTDRPRASRDIRPEQTAWALYGEFGHGGPKVPKRKGRKAITCYLLTTSMEMPP